MKPLTEIEEASTPVVEVEVTRSRIYPRPARRGRAWYWLYECVGPDGTRFDNRSIVELRSVLRRHYGREVQVIEPWKATTRQ